MSLTPKPLVTEAHMTDDEEKPKLTTNRPWLGSMSMGHLANFLSYSLVQGTRLVSLKLVIKKGEISVHCHYNIVKSGHG